MLKWALQRGTSVISKSVNPDRVLSNFKLFDWELSADDMQSFDKINCGWRHLLWRETSHHPNYPFHVLRLTIRLVSFYGACLLNLFFGRALCVTHQQELRFVNPAKYVDFGLLDVIGLNFEAISSFNVSVL